MTEYIENAIARTLGVKRWQVGRWSIEAGSGQFIPTRLGQVGIASQLEAKLSVQIAVSGEAAAETCARLQGLSGVLSTQVDQHYARGFVIDLQLALLYGKQTQHIFKALAQQFAVRGRPPKKRKSK